MLLPLLFPLCLSFIIAMQGMCMKKLRTTLGSGSTGSQGQWLWTGGSVKMRLKAGSMEIQQAQRGGMACEWFAGGTSTARKPALAPRCRQVPYNPAAQCKKCSGSLFAFASKARVASRNTPGVTGLLRSRHCCTELRKKKNSPRVRKLSPRSLLQEAGAGGNSCQQMRPECLAPSR